MLDIGLPSLNGIDAARRICKLSPKSKILFMSQESSADVVQEALALGALGYVVKAHAGSELLPAVDEVLQGRQFVGSGLSGDCFTPAAGPKISNGSSESLPQPAKVRSDSARRHEVEFYSDDTAFVVGFTRFIEAALKSGSAVIVMATESHRQSLVERLREDGLDMDAAVEQGRCIFVDVADAVSSFMLKDRPGQLSESGVPSYRHGGQGIRRGAPSRCGLWRMCSQTMGKRRG